MSDYSLMRNRLGALLKDLGVQVTPLVLERLTEFVDSEIRRFATGESKAAAKHKAIAVVEKVMGRQVTGGVVETVIALVGDNPNIQVLKAEYAAWCERGYNPAATTWLRPGWREARPGRAGTPQAATQTTLTPEQATRKAESMFL